jgi:hypothetical protein
MPQSMQQKRITSLALLQTARNERAKADNTDYNTKRIANLDRMIAETEAAIQRNK